MIARSWESHTDSGHAVRPSLRALPQRQQESLEHPMCSASRLPFPLFLYADSTSFSLTSKKISLNEVSPEMARGAIGKTVLRAEPVTRLSVIKVGAQTGRRRKTACGTHTAGQECTNTSASFRGSQHSRGQRQAQRECDEAARWRDGCKKAREGSGSRGPVTTTL